MKTTEVTPGIIGKRCKSIFTGLMVTGTIEEINITQHTAEVKVRYDEPQNWGGEWYKCDWSHGRLCDEFGSLQRLQIIDDQYQAIRVTFSKPISEIDRIFAYNHEQWGAVNLKEWIDAFESSRFTQISPVCAIITSEYNMEHIEAWLQANTPILELKREI